MSATTAEAPTATELAERAFDAQERVNQERATSRTSADLTPVAELVDEDRSRKCGRCMDEYFVAKIGGRELPARCPKCYPGKPVAEQKELGIGSTPAPGTFDILEALNDAGVNVPKYKNATLATFDGSEDRHVMPVVDRYITAWEETAKERYPARDWLYLYGAGSDRTSIGKLGNGKTFLSIAIARHLMTVGLLSPGTFRFRTAEELLLQCEATFRSKAEESESNLFKFYGSLQLLIIDDIGVRDAPSPHAVRVFDELAKRREAKATIWTSNLSIAVLHQQGEAMKRIATRLAGECGEGAQYALEFNGSNRRIARSRRAS